jgi:ribosomal protein S20
VHSLLDKIGRRRIFHPNKSARLKSQLARWVAQRLQKAQPAS